VLDQGQSPLQDIGNVGMGGQERGAIRHVPCQQLV
jgi:hypothetical protein